VTALDHQSPALITLGGHRDSSLYRAEIQAPRHLEANHRPIGIRIAEMYSATRRKSRGWARLITVSSTVGGVPEAVGPYTTGLAQFAPFHFTALLRNSC
jgi:hypothetical protein